MTSYRPSLVCVCVCVSSPPYPCVFALMRPVKVVSPCRGHAMTAPPPYLCSAGTPAANVPSIIPSQVSLEALKDSDHVIKSTFNPPPPVFQCLSVQLPEHQQTSGHTNRLVSQPVHPTSRLSVCLSMYVVSAIRTSVCVCLSIHLCLCLSVCGSVRLFVWPCSVYVCPFVCVCPVYLPVCPSACLKTLDSSL